MRLFALLLLAASLQGQSPGIFRPGGTQNVITANRITGANGAPGPGCAVVADVGKVYVRQDAAAAHSTLYTCSNTDIATFAWELAVSAGSGTLTGITGSGPSWLTWTITNPTTTPAIALAPTMAQTSHQVIGTCNAATIFGPCSLVAGDLPSTTVNAVTNDTNIQGTISGQNLTFSWAGTLAAVRMVNAGVHTGDCTTTFPNCTISASAITLAKMANLAANSIICNNTGSGTTPIACTQAQIAALLAGQALFTLTTTGSSGAATYIGGTLNIPQYSGGGATSVFTGSTATNPAFSATPTFSLADVSVKSPVRIEPGALTANVTAVTFTNKTAGAKFSIAWTQDATGGRTITYGSVAGTAACQIDPTASATTTQNFEIGADGTTVNGVGCRTSTAIPPQQETSAASTPLAAYFACWGDSTDHAGWECKANNSANIFKMVLSGVDINPVTGQLSISAVTCTNQVVTAISARGVGACNSLTAAEMAGSAVPGTSVTLAGAAQIFTCTSTCTVTVPVPALNVQYCVMNDDNVSTVITLSAIGSSARYENTARTAYGTAGTGTFVSGGAVGDMVCIVGRDSTHYLTTAFKGTWTAN